MRVIAVLWAILVSCALPAAGAGELSGRRAPGFSLPDENMNYHDLADYRGKVVLIEIMVTKCPNCQKLAASLNSSKEKYGDRIAVLSVVNPPDNRTTVQEFKKTYNVTGPVLFDCGQMVGSYLLPNPQRPRIHVPHLFLIDEQGMIRNDFDHTNTEIFEGRGLEEAIGRLLQSGSAAN